MGAEGDIIRKCFMGEATFELIQWALPGRKIGKKRACKGREVWENVLCLGTWKLLREARKKDTRRKLKGEEAGKLKAWVEI